MKYSRHRYLIGVSHRDAAFWIERALLIPKRSHPRHKVRLLFITYLDLPDKQFSSLVKKYLKVFETVGISNLDWVRSHGMAVSDPRTYRRYRKELENEFGWVKQNPDGSETAFCQVCEISITPTSSCLLTHEASARHQKNVYDVKKTGHKTPSRPREVKIIYWSCQFKDVS